MCAFTLVNGSIAYITHRWLTERARVCPLCKVTISPPVRSPHPSLDPSVAGEEEEHEEEAQGEEEDAQQVLEEGREEEAGGEDNERGEGEG